MCNHLYIYLENIVKFVNLMGSYGRNPREPAVVPQFNTQSFDNNKIVLIKFLQVGSSLNWSKKSK